MMADVGRRFSTGSVNRRFAIQLKKVENVWVASCPRLDLFTQALTPVAARAAIRQAIDVWFEDCNERGVLAQALREAARARSVDFTRAISPRLEPPCGTSTRVSGSTPL
jgi:predicted RNase H-like HicB family nuclease